MTGPETTVGVGIMTIFWIGITVFGVGAHATYQQATMDCDTAVLDGRFSHEYVETDAGIERVELARGERAAACERFTADYTPVLAFMMLGAAFVAIGGPPVVSALIRGRRPA